MPILRSRARPPPRRPRHPVEPGLDAHGACRRRRRWRAALVPAVLEHLRRPWWTASSNARGRYGFRGDRRDTRHPPARVASSRPRPRPTCPSSTAWGSRSTPSDPVFRRLVAEKVASRAHGDAPPASAPPRRSSGCRDRATAAGRDRVRRAWIELPQDLAVGVHEEPLLPRRPAQPAFVRRLESRPSPRDPTARTPEPLLADLLRVDLPDPTHEVGAERPLRVRADTLLDDLDALEPLRLLAHLEVDLLRARTPRPGRAGSCSTASSRAPRRAPARRRRGSPRGARASPPPRPPARRG